MRSAERHGGISHEERGTFGRAALRRRLTWWLPGPLPDFLERSMAETHRGRYATDTNEELSGMHGTGRCGWDRIELRPNRHRADLRLPVNARFARYKAMEVVGPAPVC